MLDQSFMFEVLGDSPENIERINNTLFDAKTMSYGASYTAQKKLAGMTKYNCLFSDGEIFRGTKYVFTIPYTYIELKNRVDFKESEYYKRPVPYSTILENHELFQTSILMFIDGIMYSNFYVTFMEDFLQISFGRYKGSTKNITDGFTIAEIQSMQSARVDFIFMPLSNHRIANFRVSELFGSHYQIDRDDVIDPMSDEFIETSDMDTSGIPMFVCAPKNQNGTYENKFGYLYEAINIESDAKYKPFTYDKDSVMAMVAEVYVRMSASNRIEVHAIYPQDLLQVKSVPSTGWFETPIMDMPIPKDNILVFQYTETGLVYLPVNLEFHYPNIYKINTSDPTARYFVYIFYNEDTEGVGLYHENELGMYYSFIDDIIGKYSAGRVPSYIRDYTPIEMEYDIEDYKESDEDGLTYKINKLRELISQNPFIYSIYLEKFYDRYPKITRTADQTFLTTRIRYSTASDIPSLQPPVVFEEGGRYLFSIRNASNNQTCLFFVDNKFVYPDRIYYTDDIVYMYFPNSIIHLGTKIEIILIYDISMAKTMTLHAGVANKVKLEQTYRVAASDIYLTSFVSADDERYVDPGENNENYGIYERIDPNVRVLHVDDVRIVNEYMNEMYYRLIDKNQFKKFDTVYIICSNELDNVEVVVRSDKTNIFRTTYGEAPNYDINEYINNKDKSNLQLYRDGRLMSKSAITFNPNVNPAGPHVLHANILVSGEIPVTMIHTSEKHSLECQYHTAEVKRLRIYQKYMDIPEELTDRGNTIHDNIMDSSPELVGAIEAQGHLVDLTGLLSKPLSFDWFDIYMNGLKLTPDDAIIVSPYRLLILIDDDYPDIDSFVIIDIVDFIDRYLMQLINPDIQQVTPEMKDEFMELVDPMSNIPLNANIGYNTRANIILDPDNVHGYRFIIMNGLYSS